MNKLELLVCRSCLRDNEQKDPFFSDPYNLKEKIEPKLKKFLFSKLATLTIVDCLTNCQNPNSVQINREDGELVLGKINTEKDFDDVISLLEKMNDKSYPLQVSGPLSENIVCIKPRRYWQAGLDGKVAAADRRKLST